MVSRDIVVASTVLEATHFIKKHSQSLKMARPVAAGDGSWRSVQGMRVRDIYVLRDALWSRTAEVALMGQLHSGRAAAYPNATEDGYRFVVWRLMEAAR